MPGRATHRRHLPSAVALMCVAALASAVAPTWAAQPVGSAAAAADPLNPRPCVYIPQPSPVAETVFGPVKNVGTPPSSGRTSPADVMTIVTNRGTLRIAMLTSAAPCTVNSFRYLASKRYFDRTHCHRLTTSGIFVLQCGDPSGTGSGGPGYMYPDENLAGASYPAGTVAMANFGPCTNGSQFFITYKDSSIPPLYTPFGRVLGHGLTVVRHVAAGGTDNSNGTGDGHPRRAVRIRTLRVTRA